LSVYSRPWPKAARGQQEDAVARQHDVTATRGRVLLGTRSPVVAQFHVQVQSDRRGGPETSPASRVSQCISTWRRSPSVSTAPAWSVWPLAAVTHYSTAIRPRYNYLTPYITTTLLHCSLNKQVSVNAASGSAARYWRRCGLNDLWQ